MRPSRAISVFFISRTVAKNGKLGFVGIANDEASIVNFVIVFIS